MHLFVTTFFGAAWDTAKHLLGACSRDANEWVEYDYRDEQTGQWLRYAGRRGGYLRFFFWYCLIGPVLVMSGIHWFIHVPAAAALGLERPTFEATTGLAYLAPITAGAAWYLLTTAWNLIRHYWPWREPLGPGAPLVTLYCLLTPDNVALTLVSRIPGMLVGMVVPVALAAVLIGLAVELAGGP